MSGTYTYANLQSAIAAAANTLPFSLSGAALQSALITTLFQAWFAADRLSINLGGNKPVDNGSQFTVTGTLSKAFRGKTSPVVQAVFSVVNGMAQVTVTVSAASGWAPSMICPLSASAARTARPAWLPEPSTARRSRWYETLHNLGPQRLRRRCPG